MWVMFLKPLKSKNQVKIKAVYNSNGVEYQKTKLCNILTKKTVHKVNLIIESKKELLSKVIYNF